MAYSLPPLTWLRAFEASARHLSFTAAARELNLTSTAVSHQVRSLEQALGYPLFERLARSLRLTEMGAAYVPDVRRAFEDLSATTAQLFGQAGATRLTIRAPVSFVMLWLAPRLAGFQARHPKIDLHLFSVIWADAVPDEAIDVDIRFGLGSWPGYEAEVLLRQPSAVVCHCDQRLAGGAEQQLDVLAARPLIHVFQHENHWAEVFRRFGRALPGGPPGMRVDNSLAALTLVAAGAGSAIVLKSYAESATATLPVALPFDFELPVQQAHWLLTPIGRRAVKAESLLFRAWLFEELAG
jgi:LysR family glycine cleavage system transcriptional activator